MLFDRIPAEIDKVVARQRALVPAFWRKFRDMPDFRGKRVLDLGCGYGPLIADVLERGANYCVGLDLSQERIEMARRIAEAEGLADRTEFHAGDIRSFPGGDFDMIVSKDTFEHIDDLSGVLEAMVARLRPGGKLYVGFGPLYHSPFGDHGWFGRLPWGHVLAGEKAVVARINKRNGTDFADLPALGLNGLKPADFRRHFKMAGVTVESAAVNSVDGLAKNVAVHPMNLLRRLPALEPYFTVSMYAVLKPETVPAEAPVRHQETIQHQSPQPERAL